MKKIYKSLFTVFLVAAAVGGATYSFLSDEETSTGNTFTAGEIDLKVDHTKQTYNDIDCKTCSVDIESDATNLVIKKDGVAVAPFNAFIVPSGDQASDWADETSIGANWIWGAAGVPAGGDTTEYTFEKKFTWFGPVVDVVLNLSISGDDNYTVFLNGVEVADESSGEVWETIHAESGFEDQILQGENKITFVVKNSGGFWAGLVYRLTIDGNCGDTYFLNHCRLWDEKDLAAGDIFFNFDDIKPGDQGTNVVSLHPDTNAAWACMSTDNEKDFENIANEVELAVPDTTTGLGPTEGELSPFLKVFAWWDTNGDGDYDLGEPAIGTTDFGTLGTLALADATTIGGPLPGGATKNLGLFWCAGTMLPPVAGSPFACSGSGMGNIAQTDQYLTDIVFFAMQERNNETFVCGEDL